MTRLFKHRDLIERSRQLRKRQTPAESKLWKYLRRKGLDGRKFRRQHSIGPYIVDFYCAEEALVIELDGSAHEHLERARYDFERQQFLEGLGLRVVRFSNERVRDQIDLVVQGIRESFIETPNPLPTSQRGGISSAANLQSSQ